MPSKTLKRMIDTGIWEHPDFLELDMTAQHLFIYLCTNPRTTNCGCYKIADTTIINSAKIPRELLDQAFEDIEVMDVMRQGHWVWIQKFTKWQNWSFSRDWIKGIENSINEISDDKLRGQVMEYNKPLLERLEAGPEIPKETTRKGRYSGIAR